MNICPFYGDINEDENSYDYIKNLRTSYIYCWENHTKRKYVIIW